MTRVIAMLVLMNTIGCSSAPMTQEESERWQRVSRGLSSLSNQLDKQNQPTATPPQRCITSPNGYGGYNTECYPW